MARYRKVDSRIWNDAKFRGLTDNGKLAFFMMLTHPNMTALGGMRTTLAGLAEELGWTAVAFRKAFAEIIGSGMAKHDEKACLLVLPNFLRYNVPESPNVIKAWTGSLDLLPECPLKEQLIGNAIAFVEGMSEAFAKALPEAFRQAKPKSMANQEQEQEQEQNPPYPPRGQKAESIPAEAEGKAPDAVDAAWEYYREKLGRSPHLELTKQRRTMGEMGLKACKRMALLSGSEDPDRAAVELLKLAIDRLAESPWHNGENDSGKKYLEWEVLFRSKTVASPNKLTDFWLSDEKFPDQRRGAA